MHTAPRTDRATVIGIALVGAAVAAYSTSSLFTTARESGVPPALAWVLPVATDVCALVCTRVWLSPRYGRGIQRYAATIVLVDMMLSFAGASLHLVVSDAPVWLRMAVGGLPSLTLAALAHLGALIAAQRTGERATPPEPAEPPTTVDAPGVDPAPGPEAVRPPGASASTVPAGTAPETPSRRAVRASNVVSMTGSGASEKKAAMLAHLTQQHRDGADLATGAELDRMHGTNGYGRKVRRDWERSLASGE